MVGRGGPPMRSSPVNLEGQFDILIVGGGIHGAFATLESARRGLRVLLLEGGDFGSGTSGNSLRIAHGGLRYLARGDLPRMRESIRERATLMRLAPHLVRPLPCVLPLAGASRVPAYAAALRINDLAVRAIAGDGAALPPGSVLGELRMRDVAGSEWWGAARQAALWYDALIISPERLLIMVLREAISHGAAVRNYAPVDSLLRDQSGQVQGVQSHDALTGERHEFRARVVLNATATGTAALIGDPGAEPCAWADGWNVVLRRSGPTAALALAHPTEPRLLFVVPWRDHVVLGTSYAARRPTGAGAPPIRAPRAPGDGLLGERARALIRDANASLPALHLREDEVVLAHAGVLPMTRDLGRRGVVLLDRALLIDHARTGRNPGLISMVGVKWTTARRVAQRAVDMCERHLHPRGRRRVPGRMEPLCARAKGAGVAPGGSEVKPTADEVPGWRERTGHLADGSRQAAQLQAADSLPDLYGPLAWEVTEMARAEPGLLEPLAPGCRAIGAQVAHAFRREGAVHLTDALMRRTDVGAVGWPGEEAVRRAAEIAAGIMGWNDDRTREEVHEVRQLLAGST